MKENYEGNVFSPMGKWKLEGRFNQGVVSPWKDENGNYINLKEDLIKVYCHWK